MKLTRWLVLAALAVVTFPVLALAQDLPTDTSGGIALEPIIALVSGLLGVLAALANVELLKGWRTYINVAVVVLNTVMLGLTDLMVTSPRAGLVAILMAAVGAAIGRKRATA